MTPAKYDEGTLATSHNVATEERGYYITGLHYCYYCLLWFRIISSIISCIVSYLA